ncbi:MAG TPA: hypothetical protein VFP98_06995, partial [Candidatus Polarisedimenticolia bacterium]|nr:hypothetical protein [Candidatus Polarisedimenticolia bacterium]
MIKSALATLLLLTLSGPAAPRPAFGAIDVARRIEARRAIERVYHARKVGETRPFEEAVPYGLVERQVRHSLKQESALARRYGVRITESMLRDEAARMSRGTRLPDRLRELHAALDNDPALILEALVRPVLVDRLVRTA